MRPESVTIRHSRRDAPAGARLCLFLAWACLWALAACDGVDPDRRAGAFPAAVTEIRSMDHFNQVVDSAGSRLLVFDMYADWCFPCKELEPILQEIARENGDKTDFYRIDMDSLRPVADVFKVRGIPHVAFVRKGTIVFSLMGLHPKSKYTEVIQSLTR